jgi:transcriptional regulator with XRE-family HTH domain
MCYIAENINFNTLYSCNKNKEVQCMFLDEYLFRKKMTQKQFAQLIEISTNHLGQLVIGNRTPTVKLAKLIEEKTGGDVTKEEMLFPEEHKNKRITV